VKVVRPGGRSTFAPWPGNAESGTTADGKLRRGEWCGSPPSEAVPDAKVIEGTHGHLRGDAPRVARSEDRQVRR
jgi:hypothetical protein